MRAIKLLSVFLVFSFLFGCTYRPAKVLFVHKAGDIFVIATTEDIMFVDARTHATLNSVKMPSHIFQIIPDGKCLIAELHGSYDNAPIYRIYMTGQTEKIGHVSGFFSKLIGADDEYIYILTSERKAIRLNKEINSVVAGHFDAYPDLMVVNIWEDNNYYWYACLRAGELSLVQKNKTDESLNFSPIDKGPYRSVFVTGDSTSIYLLAISADNRSNVIEFRKKGHTININKLEKEHNATMHAWLMPLPIESQELPAKYIWAVDENFDLTGMLYRISLDSFTTDELSTPTADYKPVRTSNLPVFSGYPLDVSSPLYSDSENIWIGAVIQRSPRNSRYIGEPHLIKLSKDTLQHETFVIKQIPAGSIGNLIRNAKDLGDDFFAPEILIGLILCVLLMSIFFLIIHSTRKHIAHPFLSAIMASIVLSIIAVAILFAISSGEGGLVILVIAPSLFIGFIVGGFLIALIYNRVVKK